MDALRMPSVVSITLALVVGTAALAVAQEAPTTSIRTDILPGVNLTVEEVEPDVYRVTSDGERELAWRVEPEAVDSLSPPGFEYWLEAVKPNIGANREGVWLGRPDGIVSLGADDDVWRPDKDGGPIYLQRTYAQRFEVAPDGTLYVARYPKAILGAGGWREVPRPGVRGFDFAPRGDHGSIRFGPDGAMWVQGQTNKGNKKQRDAFARRDDDGWTLIKVPLPQPKLPAWPPIEEMAMTAGGDLYVLHAGGWLQRYDGQRWRALPPLDSEDARSGYLRGLSVGDDGTVWVGYWGDEMNTFHRLDRAGETWARHELGTRHAMRDPWDDGQGPAAAAAPDGALWFPPGDGRKEDGRCDGIARFDGTIETRFLRGLCVYDITFGPGGDTWVLAGDWTGSVFDPDEVGPVEPYVITAEAMPPAA